jgi:hypothetical protein
MKAMKLVALFASVVAMAVRADYNGEPLNYQGRLVSGTNLYSGTASLRFRVYSAPSGGTLEYEATNIATVVDGLYSTLIGQYRTLTNTLASALADGVGYLEVQVNGVTLSPREQLAAAPLANTAMQLGALRVLTNATSPSLVGGHTANSAGTPGSVVGGGGTASFPNQGGGTYSVVVGGYGNTVYTNTPEAFIGGGSMNWVSNGNSAIVGGAYNGIRAITSFIGGGYGNTITLLGSIGVIGGGVFNTNGSADGFIGGGRGNALVSGSQAAIGGGTANTVAGSQSLIVGGGYNSVSGAQSAVVGGYSNTIESATLSFIGGGWINSIATANVSVIVGGGYHGIGSNSAYATIGGGFANRLYGSDFGVLAGGSLNRLLNSGNAFVGGGSENVVDNGSLSVIGGGYSNFARGLSATVPGGQRNDADSDYSFAAGYRAKALGVGTFVWADSTDQDFASALDNCFAIRASGGVGIGSAEPRGPLHILSSNVPPAGLASYNNGLLLGSAGAPNYKWIQSYGGSLSLNPLGNNVGIGVTNPASLFQVFNATCDGNTWFDTSDALKKTDFEPVNPADVLDRVARLPVATWRYRTDAPGNRHMGPTAQDFHEAFGLGSSDTTIATVDRAGVALAAIQGLYLQNRELRAELDRLRAELDALKAE